MERIVVLILQKVLLGLNKVRKREKPGLKIKTLSLGIDVDTYRPQRGSKSIQLFTAMLVLSVSQ